ncbi:hypothetical protein AgCh_039043 [Apium graveolens]
MTVNKGTEARIICGMEVSEEIGSGKKLRTTTKKVREKHKSKQGHVLPVEHGSSKVNVVTVGQKREVVTKKANTKLDKNKAKKQKANKPCWSCGQVGHWSKDCPSKKAKKAGVVAQANTVLGLGTTSGPVANMVIGEVVASGTDDGSLNPRSNDIGFVSIGFCFRVAGNGAATAAFLGFPVAMVAEVDGDARLNPVGF